MHDAHRGIQQIGLVVGQHLAHAVDKRDELAARDEIFVQDVGIVGQRVAQVRHGIVHRVVAVDEAGFRRPDRLRPRHRTGLHPMLDVLFRQPFHFLE